MACKECQLWDIESAKDKAGRVQKRWAAKCTWQSTEPWPISVQRREVRPTPTYMCAHNGEGCECFIKRTSKN